MTTPGRRREIVFLQALLHECESMEELTRDALCTLLTHHFLVQLERGGFWQFVHDSRWEPGIVELVREGLIRMGLREQLRVFDRGAEMIQEMGPVKLDAFLRSDYRGKVPAT